MSGLTSGAPEPGIRTYNPQVRVGNWNEDICLEEDLLRGTYFFLFLTPTLRVGFLSGYPIQRKKNPIAKIKNPEPRKYKSRN